MNNVVNTVAYLRTSRDFSVDEDQFRLEISKSYIDTANAINVRTIGIFSINRPAITGESWFIKDNQKQQTLRQVYTFTTTSNIDIGFKLTSISGFTRMFGVYKSGTSWYGLIPATNVAIAGQITFWVEVNGASTTSDVIKFNAGGAPALSEGKIVLEWLSFV